MLRILLLALTSCLVLSAAQPCESLRSLTISNLTVTSATSIAAGAPLQGVGRGRSASLKLPAFCRVAAGSDTGHSGDDLKFVVGHPSKIDDWGWRAIHTMTENAKLIVRAGYGKFAEHSYFTGCSTGGHQALMEAQRFPADYDGIVAGDPGNNRVRLNIGFLWSWLALYKDTASGRFGN